MSKRKLFAMVAGFALMATAALQASSVSATIDVTGTAALGSNAPTTTFSGSGTGTSKAFGPLTFSTAGNVDTTGVNGFSGTMTLDFASGSDLDASFSESSGLSFSSIPVTITGGTGIFNDATGSFTADITGFPTSATTANFTMVASGLVSGPNIPTSSTVPEPGSFALLTLGIGAAAWACSRRKRA